MFSQTKISQFRQMRAANIERDMGGVTTGGIAVVRLLFLLVTSWGILGAGIAGLIGVLKLVGASLDVAIISFFAFLLMWLCFSFSRSYSRLIDWLVTFFEGGLLPLGIGFFRQPASSIIFPRFIRYISPVLGIPTAPPRRLA